jgi:serine/threonine protein kinase
MSEKFKIKPVAIEDCKTKNQTSSSFAFSNSKRRNLLLSSHSKVAKPAKSTITRSKFVSKNGSIEDYKLEDLLGKGSYGEVYKATHIENGKEVAIKMYDKYKMSEANKKKSMLNEIRLLKKLDHPNLIKLHAVHETPSKIYLVMDLVKGVALSEYSRSLCKHKLDEFECKKIFKQIIKAVDHLHSKNICHRDIKLENILITKDDVVKILDFGFAVKYNPNKKMKTF